ncbi:MAG: NAD(P)H-hydrate epimerase, partial [Gammaproteobacteria bacterium]
MTFGTSFPHDDPTIGISPVGTSFPHDDPTIGISPVLLIVQIFSAEQIRAWDQYTIEHEPVSSIDLMERASAKCVQWIVERSWRDKPFYIFCGKGNNGGDGLAIGRMLMEKGYEVSFFILEFGKPGSNDFQANLQQLHNVFFADLHFIQSEEQFPSIAKNAIIIDTLFGSGLNKPLEGLAAALVHHLNESAAPIVSIDLPSGLFIDQSSVENTVVNASFTLTFQCYKLGLLVQENAPFIGEVQVLDIGLHPAFLDQPLRMPQLLDEVMIRMIHKPRKRFSHKGTFGHALIIGGSYGKIGAALLATKACLHSGAGLTTTLIPRCGYTIMQSSAPEAMALVDEE